VIGVNKVFGGQILLGSGMIVLTTVIHTIGIIFLIAMLKRLGVRDSNSLGYPAMTGILVLTILVILVLHTVEIWIWAAMYFLLDQFQDFARALYFSVVTYTTLGYGDIVLKPRWQLLSSLEAVNGIILFGVSTAFVFAVMRRLFELGAIIEPER
jgi:Ion channel